MDSYTVSYKDKEVGYYNAYDDGTAAYYTAWGSPWDMEDELRELGLEPQEDGADGICGKQMLKAVKAFQEDCGIIADGIVGRITYGKLNGEG